MLQQQHQLGRAGQEGGCVEEVVRVVVVAVAVPVLLTSLCKLGVALFGGWESILRSWKLLLAVCCLHAELCEECYTEVFIRNLLEV